MSKKKKAQVPFKCVGCKTIWRDGWPAKSLPLIWDGHGNMAGVCEPCSKTKCAKCKKVHDSYWCCKCKKTTATKYDSSCEKCGHKKYASYQRVFARNPGRSMNKKSALALLSQKRKRGRPTKAVSRKLALARRIVDPGRRAVKRNALRKAKSRKAA